MKKDRVIKIIEKIIEITPEEEYEYLGNDEFVCLGNTLNYPDLVNSKVRDGEIGYIIENRIKKRLIVISPIKNLELRRSETARFFRNRFEYFLPYWKYEHSELDKKEIGRMFGCRITLP